MWFSDVVYKKERAQVIVIVFKSKTSELDHSKCPAYYQILGDNYPLILNQEMHHIICPALNVIQLIIFKIIK